MCLISLCPDEYVFSLCRLEQVSSFRLQKADKDLQLRLEEEGKKVAENQAALEEEKNKLLQTTTELQSAQHEAQALKHEAESLLQRARALEEAVGQLQGEVDQARAELREREAEERRLCLNVEQLETDLRSSKALTESLQTELNEKEKREVEMLGEKEQAVAEVITRFHPQRVVFLLCGDTLNTFHTVRVCFSGCRGGEEGGRQQGARSRGGAGAKTGRSAGSGGETEEGRGGEQQQKSQAGLFHEGHGLPAG